MSTRPMNSTGGLLAALVFCNLAAMPAAADSDGTTSPAPQQVTLIRSPPEILTRQKLPNFVGISAQTAGARGLSMNLVIIPPGASAEPQ